MERTPKRPSAGNHAPGGQLGHLGRELSPEHAPGPAVIHHAHHLLRRDRVSGRNRERRGKLRCRRSCCVRASHHPLRQAECRPRDERRDQALLGYTRTTPKPSKNFKVQETTRTSTAMPSAFSGGRGRNTKGQGGRGNRAVQGVRGGALGCMEGRGGALEALNALISAIGGRPGTPPPAVAIG